MNATHHLRRIGPFSVAKLFGVLYAILGLIIGALVSLIALVGSAIGSTSSANNPVFGIVFGVAAVIVLPIIYGAMGFLGGLITAGLYNLVAGIVGGIELELAPRQ